MNQTKPLSSMELGTQLVKMCREGQNAKAIEMLYSRDIMGIEAQEMPGMGRVSEGFDAVLGKTKWWGENHTVHSATVEGPFPFEDRFAVYFKYDITQKATGKRINMAEVGIYHCQNGKIVREEFYYPGA